MDVLDAAYATVHDYPGGASALAPRAGFSSPHVLNSKVRPGCGTHHLTLVEANRLIGLTGNTCILRAMAEEHGYMLVSVQEPTDGGNVLASVLDVGEANGDLARTIRAAVADGVITPREIKEIQRSGDQAQATIIMLMAKLRAAARGCSHA